MGTCDASLGQKVLRKIGNALFGKDQIWLERDDVVADFLDVIFFELEDSREIGFVRKFHICLALSLKLSVGKMLLSYKSLPFGTRESNREALFAGFRFCASFLDE